jgi:magnesium chelatase subunit D
MTDLESRQVNQTISTLCAAALVRGLRSILVFDANPRELRKIARTAAKILSDFSQQPVNTLTLGSSETDDDLWGSFMPHGNNEESPLFWQPGLLFGSEDENSTRVALIPNLAQLSLMSARTCIALVGESVAALERHGQHRFRQPDIFWVAGCPAAEVGKVSAHLLDRFALRLNRKNIQNPAERVEEIKRMINSEESEEDEASFPLPAYLGETLRVAAQFRPRMTDEAVAHIGKYIPMSGFYSARRDLALARLAVANAQLDKSAEVVKEHVNRAAQIIGLSLPIDKVEEEQREREEPEEQKEKQPDPLSVEESPVETPQPEQVATVRPEPQLVQEFALEVDVPPEAFPVSALPPASETSPYPEDETPVEHEDTPLRLPSRLSRADEAGKGPVIGTEHATSLHDLALVRTLLEAAKFQPVRQKNFHSSEREFMLLPSDLHSYRREPIAEQMLVLLIDYTSFKDSAWEDALFPYLKEAYTGRAMICLIKVGAADARHELRAERIEARSILVPEIAKAFNARPGRATPLAHGLDLAFQALRRYLQHGRSGPYQATFVVLSDGRGNVPLEDSRRGEIAAPVMRKGFDDALRLARQIRDLDYVRVVYLNPQPLPHTELPLELTEALGAESQEIPLRLTQHV